MSGGRGAPLCSRNPPRLRREFIWGVKVWFRYDGATTENLWRPDSRFPIYEMELRDHNVYRVEVPEIIRGHIRSVQVKNQKGRASLSEDGAVILVAPKRWEEKLAGFCMKISSQTHMKGIEGKDDS